MDANNQSVEDIDELHNSILSLCEDKFDGKDSDVDETNGDFIKSLNEYTQNDTIQNTTVSTDHDKSNIEFVTIDSFHNTRESPDKGDKVQRSVLEVCDTSYPSPDLTSGSSSAQSPGVIGSGKRKFPNESGDNLEVSSILNTPIQSKDSGKNKSTRKVIYQSTPLDPQFKGMFKASSVTAQSTPLNSNSQKDCPLLSHARLNLFKEAIYDELGVLDEEDDPTVTFEELLSELTLLIGDDDRDKEKPAQMKSEELKLLSSVKTENQISRIDLDSLLLEDGRRKCDDVDRSSCINASNSCYGKPGRFSRLNATVRNTVIEEVDGDVDETEDILGLDDYTYNDAELEELSSDEEKTLLFDESALCKTVINKKSKSQRDEQELKRVSNDAIVSVQSSKKDESHQSSTLYLTVGSVVNSVDDNFLDLETSIKDDKESRIDELNKNDDNKNNEVILLKDEEALDSKGGFLEEVISKETKAEKNISKEKDFVLALETDGNNKIKNLDKDMLEKKDDESEKILVKEVVTTNVCKVSPVKVSTPDQPSEIVTLVVSQEVLPSDKPKTESKTLILNDSVEPASEKMKEVMMRWNSKNIPKPDTNLTHAHWARENLGIQYGQLEGHHLSTLDKTTNKIKTSEEQPPAKRQKIGNVTPMCNAKAYLEAQIRELNVIECNNADEIYRERRTVLTNLQKEEFQRFRMLYMKQQMEIRQLHAHYNSGMINTPFFNVQLLQLRQEHDLQKFQLKGVYSKKVEEKHRFYFQKVSKRNQQYTHRKEQLNCLLNQLMSQPKLDQDNNNRYGPHVTVDLVKGPCVTNNQTSSIVTVCIPADIAAAIIKEDEIYDMFYEHPKLTKQDYIFKKKTTN